MSLTRLRTRLDRLEHLKQLERQRGSDPPPAFRVDPVFAKALRDDYLRRDHLWRKRDHGGGLTSTETVEHQVLDESIKARAKTIAIPANYDCERDEKQLHRYWARRRSGPPLTEAEDAAEAQAQARSLAYNETPEARDQLRLFELGLRKFSRKGLSAAEKDEFDTLEKLYPRKPLDPDDPMDDAIKAWQRAIAEEEVREAKSLEEWAAKRKLKNTRPDANDSDFWEPVIDG